MAWYSLPSVKVEKLKRRPYVRAYGEIPINRVSVFVPKIQMFFKSYSRDGPITCFIDVNTPKNHFRGMDGPELHIGILGDFKVDNLRKGQTDKSRIDINIPLESLGGLINILERMRCGK